MRKPLENQWAQDLLQRGTHILSATVGDWTPRCATCQDIGTIYAKEPYVINGRSWGEREVEIPCPDCSGACPACGGMGVVRYDLPLDHPDFGRLFPCLECEKGAQVADQMQALAQSAIQLPMQYKTMTFKSWDALSKKEREGKRLARAAAGLFVQSAATGFYVERRAYYEAAGKSFSGEDFRRNTLVFQGAVGMGKTGLAAAIANALAETHAHSLMYIRARDLITRVQSHYQTNDAESVLKDIISTPLLIVDEFNLAQDSANRTDMMETLIRHRYGNLLPTVITLNANKTEMESEWGIRTASALNAMAHWLTMGGAPLRREPEAEEAW